MSDNIEVKLRQLTEAIRVATLVGLLERGMPQDKALEVIRKAVKAVGMNEDRPEDDV